MLQHRSMHAATVWRAERVSRACGWCARRAQSLLSNWSSRTQFYGAMPNFPTALRLLVVLWLWHTVAMDAQHTHQGKEDFQQQPAMGSGWKMLKLVQYFFLLHQLVTKNPNRVRPWDARFLGSAKICVAQNRSSLVTWVRARLSKNGAA